MERINKVQPPEVDQVTWTSPDVLTNRDDQGGLPSTPSMSVWPSLSLSLESSEGSSKQDSGYCSLTPSSADSPGEIFSKQCQYCRKPLGQNFVQSTPEYVGCCCQTRKYYKNRLIRLDHPQTISEISASPSQPFSIRPRKRSIDLYDEAMDTSLYTDEMEVEDQNFRNDHQCVMDVSGIGDEKSIDFVERGEAVASSSHINVEMKNSNEPQNFKRQDVENDEFVSHDACSEIIPKVGNGLIAANKKRTNFESVAKKVATYNLVIKTFKLCGLERIDFFYHLTVKRNFPNIVSKILSFLSEAELNRVRVVSKTWNKVFRNDCQAYNRWKLYMSTERMQVENTRSPTKMGNSGGRQRGTPSSPLRILHNINNTHNASHSGSPIHNSPPVSPRSARFHSFQKAAKTLKKGERLLPCPKCYFPSHDSGSPVVQCSRSGCRHRFCVWCRSEITSGLHHECPPLFTPRVRRVNYKLPPIGSKICKQNLRRL